MPEYPDRDPTYRTPGPPFLETAAGTPSEPDRQPRTVDGDGRQYIQASDATEPMSLVTKRQLDGAVAGLGGAVAWEDVGTTSAASLTLPSFALTGGTFFFTSTPAVCDAAIVDGGVMHFSGTASDSFYMGSNGRARILRPGMYVIGCQMYVNTLTTIANDTYIYLHLAYQGDKGYSIEVPWAESGFNAPPDRGEEIIGSRYVYPVGAAGSHEVGLQRLHPISLTSASIFPVEILPTFLTNYEANVSVRWLGLWGYRLSGPLDAYHSD